MPSVNKLETWEVFVHKSTPHNRHHKHTARSFVVKKIFSTRGRIYDFGCWMSFTRQASGRLLRRGIEGWPVATLSTSFLDSHSLTPFLTYIHLEQIKTFVTYSTSTVWPPFSTPAQLLWPEAQAGESSCLSLPVPNLLKGAPALSHHLESSRQSLCTWRAALYAPGALHFSPAWLFLHLVLVVKYIDWLFQLSSPYPLALNLSEIGMHRVYLFISLKLVDVWFEMCRVNCTRISRRQLWLPDSHFGICWQTFTAALRTGGSHFLFHVSCN